VEEEKVSKNQQKIDALERELSNLKISTDEKMVCVRKFHL